MKVVRANSDNDVTFLIYPFVNKDDTPNLENVWIYVALDKRFDTVEILNLVKVARVNAFECSILATCWRHANEIALALCSGKWQDIAVDETMEAQE